ncbi:DUF3482 domain-containing protein [Piscinibacter sp.]|uniref:DUF3482 domain-containing protein n=1 Tax=Piscinibacter sp. TaxID=1903157 RepID=UPI002D17742E|nr:DUF3482 domain-containing protein [Albitalea sp.]HUG26423.1 DUF3482 domain-containing protein [Albitalea sp.]
MTDDTPAFAIVGAVNHGKSSVVSTLAEDDRVRVSAMPGETVEVQRFSLRDLFVFYDTPGFQNAREALAELRAAADAPDPLQAFRDFVERHRGDPAFDAECRLFAPVAEGAGLIYVVDGSRPLLDIHLAEMEVLRLTGAPRLAVINRSGTDDHVQAWKRRLGLHFNAVREFNAQRASFADRIELLETLAGIEQRWKPGLTQAIALLRTEWEARLDDCAELIVDLLADCLAHSETQTLQDADAGARAEAAEALKRRYMDTIAAKESRTHGKIISLFSHHLVSAGSDTDTLFADDLFSEQTWQLLGLKPRQLMTAGAVAGAATGATADAMTVGHTLLAGTAIGAAIGAAGAYIVGKQRPDLAVGVPRERMPGALRMLLPERIRLGGDALSVGPYAALNFPWILLDRAIATLAYVVDRPHARRDRVTLQANELVAALASQGFTVAHWDDADRKACERGFAAMRRDKLDAAGRAALRGCIRRHLTQVAGVKA